MSLSIHVPYQNAAATRACDAATTMLLPQHTAAEAVLLCHRILPGFLKS